MHKVSIINRLIFTLLVSFAVTSCSKSAETDAVEASLLQYVPADTPYLFANTEPVPDDVMDALEPGIDSTLKAYAKVIRAVVKAELEKATEEGGADADEAATIEAVGNELASLLSLEGLRSAGIGRESTVVMYGEGLLPVFRMRLTDSALMEQAISRIEEKSGSKMATASIGDQNYRFAGDDKAEVILALVGNDLVVTMVPKARTDELLKSVLGLSKQAKSIAESGQVDALIAENKFEPYYLFFVDFTRIASTFLDEQSGSNAELLALTEFDSSALSDVCRSEIRDMAGVAPRIVAGYTRFTAAEISSNFVIEMREDIAAGLATLVAPVQGLGVTKGGLFSFGMSLDLLAARAFYSARLDAMEADPFECEEFAELNAGVVQGRELLKQPIPPIAYSVKGFLAVVDAMEGMDVGAQQPPTSVDASFLLATDNPQGLVAMGAMFSPDIAALDLKADGKPQKIQLPPMSPMLSEAHIAMTDDSLVLSVGAGGADRIIDLLKQDYANPPPFAELFMDAGQYYSFIADSMIVAQSTEDETSLEVIAAMSELMRTMEGWFSDMSISVNFTERGVEMPSIVKFVEEE